MATKDNSETANASIEDYNPAEFADNITNYASVHEAFKLMPLPSFDENHRVGADITQPDTGDNLQLQLPVELRDNVVFVRIGEHHPSGVPIVIATTKQRLAQLVTDGIAYQHEEEVELPFSHGELTLEIYGGR